MKNDLIFKLVACPCDKKAELRWDKNCLYCEGAGCCRQFPIIDGTPILINEDESIFSVRDILTRRSWHSKQLIWTEKIRRVGKRFVKYVPTIGANWRGTQNIQRLRALLLERSRHSIVLVIGSGEGDRDLAANLDCSEVTLIHTDVYLAPGIDLIADAHELPFKSQSIDAIVCQSVLEHVADPYRCVSEIHRLLKPDGIVYAEIPFIQQVHAKAYDFTRFTLGGLRRLFRCFEPIDAGVEGGPGMALAWSITWFLRALSGSVIMESFVYFILPFFICWLKYIDYFIVDSPRAADAASELYFLGRRSDSILSDSQIVAEYQLRLK